MAFMGVLGIHMGFNLPVLFLPGVNTRLKAELVQHHIFRAVVDECATVGQIWDVCQRLLLTFQLLLSVGITQYPFPLETARECTASEYGLLLLGRRFVRGQPVKELAGAKVLL